MQGDAESLRIAVVGAGAIGVYITERVDFETTLPHFRLFWRGSRFVRFASVFMCST